VVLFNIMSSFETSWHQKSHRTLNVKLGRRVNAFENAVSLIINIESND